MTKIFADFQDARGYKIERENYLEDLKSKNYNCHNWREEPRQVPETHLRQSHYSSSSYLPLPNHYQQQHTLSESYQTRRYPNNCYFSNRDHDRHTNREPRRVPATHLRQFHNSRSSHLPLRNHYQQQRTLSESNQSRRYPNNNYFSKKNLNRHTNRERFHTRKTTFDDHD